MRKSDLYFLAAMPFAAISMTKSGNGYTLVFTLILTVMFIFWDYLENRRDK